MENKKIIASMIVIAGITLIVYGINHMNFTGAKIADLFGQEDRTGMFCIIGGAIIAIFGAVRATKK